MQAPPSRIFARDRWIPPAHAAEFAARIPDVTLHRYAGLGHVPMEEDPQRVAADLLRFLERADTAHHSSNQEFTS